MKTGAEEATDEATGRAVDQAPGPAPAAAAPAAGAPGTVTAPGTVPGSARELAARVCDLVKTYPAGRTRRGVPAVEPVRASDGISLEVRRGEIFGLLGPNGAGKSTLVRQLTGLLRPDSGTVRVLGHDLVRYPQRAARLLAYLGQESTALDELTVALAAETTARLRGLGARAARRERDTVLEELGLGRIAGRPLTKLSGGQRRLACVAAALVGDRPVLVLDEPTSGMDPVARRAVWAAVDRRRAERGATVVLVTHNVNEAETVLDRVAVLERGRVIACDTPGGLKALVGEDVRLELVWRDRPPLEVPEVAALREAALARAARPGQARDAAAVAANGTGRSGQAEGTPAGPGRGPGPGQGMGEGTGAGLGSAAQAAAAAAADAAVSADAGARRWTLRLAPEEARAAVSAVTGGPALAALDDFTLSTPSLEDVYLALGGCAEGLVKA